MDKIHADLSRGKEAIENNVNIAIAERKIEDTLKDAVSKAEAARTESPIAVLQLASHGIEYGEVNEGNLTPNARQAKAELHKLRAESLFWLGNLIESVEEMDKAICVACDPSPQFIQATMLWNVWFCNWCAASLKSYEEEVLSYFDSKKKRMHQLSKVPSAKVGTLLLADQCCALAHTIWSQDRTLVGRTVVVDLMAYHAELLIEMDNWTAAEQVVQTAFKQLNGNTARLYYIAARLKIHTVDNLKTENDRQKKIFLCDEALQHLSVGLNISPTDEELLRLKATAENMKSELTGDTSQWAMTTDDWGLEAVKEVEMQKKRQEETLQKYKSRGASGKNRRSKLKQVRRKQNEETDSEDCCDEQQTEKMTASRAVDRLTEEVKLQLTVGKSPELTADRTSSRRQKATSGETSTKANQAPTMRYLTTGSNGTVSAQCGLQGEKSAKKKKVPTATLR